MTWTTGGVSPAKSIPTANRKHPSPPAQSPDAAARDRFSGALDELLVRRCLDGSDEAWDALIARYRHLIFSIPIKLGLSRDDAADIFQDVCVKLLRELPRLREPRTLPKWLITVTTHESMHWRRKHARQQWIENTVENCESHAAVDPPAAVAEELRREQVLREAVLALGGRCRELVNMLFYTTPAVPYEDVAKKLSLAVGSLGFIRRRCLNRLRRLLEERDFR
jgi:RNA polymerase sigma factor (sigma-70 family)